MMKSVLVFIIFHAVVVIVSCQHSDHDSYEGYNPSEETLNFEESSLDYMSCVEGMCIPEDHEASYITSEHQIDEVEYLQDASSHGHVVPKSPYFTFCKKLDRKMRELESLHPELKAFKFQLLSMLDASISHFDSECEEGESIIDKLLDFVVYVAEKLKADFAEIMNKKVPVQIVSTETPTEEVVAEEIPGFVGSVRGIPGENYPDYTEVPITSFSCSDKKYVPGFYADLETGCQVFHVCYEHRRESFLCPPGTVFNQPILACDYWYSSNCSQAPLYYDVNAEKETIEVSKEETNIGDMITTIIEGDKLKKHEKPDFFIPKGDLNDLLKFLPIKAEVLEFQQPIKPKLMPSMPVVVLPKIKPLPLVKPIIKPLHLVKPKLAAKAIAAIPLAKAKFAAAALPVKAKVISAAAIPVVKAKVVSAAAIPVVKAKVVSAAAIPVVKAKVVSAAAIPVVKAKVVSAAAIPVVKAKVVSAAAIPVVKAKVVSAAAIPVVKAKVVSAAAIPVVKAKVVSAAAIPVVKAKVVSAAAIPVVKAKVVSAAAIPVVKAKVVSAAAIPVVKAKVVSAAAIPVVKAKVVSAAAIPVVKAKVVSAAAIPVVKAKVVSAAAIPVIKAKVAANVIKSKFVKLPIMKTKYAAAASVPVFKAKTVAKVIPYVKLTAKKHKFVAGVPIVKAKLAKAAMISPLTKKILAIGYMKLLKAKKLGLMG